MYVTRALEFPELSMSEENWNSNPLNIPINNSILTGPLNIWMFWLN